MKQSTKLKISMFILAPFYFLGVASGFLLSFASFPFVAFWDGCKDGMKYIDAVMLDFFELNDLATDRRESSWDSGLAAKWGEWYD